MIKGYWTISISCWDTEKECKTISGPPSKSTLEHIGDLIKRGFTEGDIIEEPLFNQTIEGEQHGESKKEQKI
ncbi:MAG: hypothetical protein M1480_13750 [Bacteroidetes bacterium]|nr:hypothetical protein [Bacteroidota bacterium]